MTIYDEFLASKAVRAPDVGFEPRDLLPSLLPLQRHVVPWACRKGRAAVFADCGLGKTLIELEWARQVVAATGRRVCILAPLAVAQQTVREGAQFGIACTYAPRPVDAGDAPIVITNYERLPQWLKSLSEIAGVVLDESSILKSYSGATKKLIVESFRETPYRLACTATPAPNDHLELGNHAEFLGVMSSHEMLARWFLPDTSMFGTYRLKGHAVAPFWDWVSSWAVCAGRPSDLGLGDDGYVLPEMHTHRHVVDVDVVANRGSALFRVPDMSATSVHAEKRRTSRPRAGRVAALVAAEPNERWVVWCETNYEADALLNALPEASEVRGSMTLEHKERILDDFTAGRSRVLIGKPSICGLGLNWQHCARVAFAGATFSFESYYQAVRRVWRFGQRRPVDVHVVLGATELHIWSVLQRKAQAHEEMQGNMFAAARRAQARMARPGTYNPTREARLPAWLTNTEAT